LTNLLLIITITLAWDPGVGIDSYRLYIDGKVAWSGSATTTRIEVPCKDTTFTVRAVKGATESVDSDPAHYKIKACDLDNDCDCDGVDLEAFTKEWGK